MFAFAFLLIFILISGGCSLTICTCQDDWCESTGYAFPRRLRAILAETCAQSNWILRLALAPSSVLYEEVACVSVMCFTPSAWASSFRLWWRVVSMIQLASACSFQLHGKSKFCKEPNADIIADEWQLHCMKISAQMGRSGPQHAEEHVLVKQEAKQICVFVVKVRFRSANSRNTERPHVQPKTQPRFNLPWKKGLAAVFNLRAACGRAVVRRAASCFLSHVLMNCSGLRHKLHTWQDDQIKTAQVRDGAVRQGPKRLQHLLSRHRFQVHASYAASVWQPAALGHTGVCLTRFFALVEASHSHAR